VSAALSQRRWIGSNSRMASGQARISLVTRRACPVPLGDVAGPFGVVSTLSAWESSPSCGFPREKAYCLQLSQ
jgi:hypothetical protein